MGLFGKKRELPPLISDEELGFGNAINYSTVLDYLTGLSDEDYKKICEVAQIYRAADQNAAGVLGIEYQPTTSIKRDQHEELEPLIIDKEPNFLFDDELPKPKKATKVKVEKG